MSRPYFSILIPTYNSALLATRCIDSCIMQSFTSFELIVADDSTSDDVSAAVASYVDPRITYHRNLMPAGAVSNWNRLLGLARGSFIKLLHHDDFFTSAYSLETLYTLARTPKARLSLMPSTILIPMAALTCIEPTMLKSYAIPRSLVISYIEISLVHPAI